MSLPLHSLEVDIYPNSLKCIHSHFGECWAFTDAHALPSTRARAHVQYFQYWTCARALKCQCETCARAPVHAAAGRAGDCSSSPPPLPSPPTFRERGEKGGNPPPPLPTGVPVQERAKDEEASCDTKQPYSLSSAVPR